ncbi:MAG: hypothetical protein EPN97_17775 [Alphaproteobacteria bacterium]|nr:MAG: hypothetical protein EPN97_17775 [Alphaproteobacteria bacterium]
MTDISDTHDKMLQTLKNGGILPSDIPRENQVEITDYVNQAICRRFLALLPGINLGDSCDPYVLREVQKLNPAAGEHEVTRALDTAAAETIEAIKGRPAWKKANGLPAQAAEGIPRNLHLIKALDGALRTMFAEGIMWSQCCGNDKAPYLFHYMQAALSLRLLNRIPGFDTGSEIAEFDRKILLQIHEFNEQPNVMDVGRILDAAMDKTFEELRLQDLQKITVLKPLQLAAKTPGL